MPMLRTDDGPRKLRAIWLGPKGATLPFEWSYVQWCVTLLVLPVGIVAGILLLAAISLGLFSVPSWWFAGPIGFLAGGMFSLWLSVRLMRGVTFDEPLRYKLAIARAELGRKRHHAAGADWAMPWPNITDNPN